MTAEREARGVVEALDRRGAGDDALGWTAATLIDYFRLVPVGSWIGTTAQRSTTADQMTLAAACALEGGFFDSAKIERAIGRKSAGASTCSR